MKSGTTNRSICLTPITLSIMKKAIFLLGVCFFTLAVPAQTHYTVPALSDLQKYQAAALQLNGAYLIQISFAKAQNGNVEKAAKYFGDQLASTWNKPAGFDGLVQGIIYMMATLVPYGSVEITGQDSNSVTFLVTGLFPELREGGSVYGVTYPEYLKFWNIALSQLSGYLGAEYCQNDTDEGLRVVIRRKSP